MSGSVTETAIMADQVWLYVCSMSCDFIFILSSYHLLVMEKKVGFNYNIAVHLLLKMILKIIWQSIVLFSVCLLCYGNCCCFLLMPTAVDEKVATEWEVANTTISSGTSNGVSLSFPPSPQVVRGAFPFY